ncbi:patatin-like phospholipase family protein [Aridibaculum aurantiacum]|uniref:patatin-like phospholipase family protein n=1 Tax=Aridibaculum aurantiacum TaxID=2810307 RepID=UPI001A96B9EA|nr:patatin-like phospholipase family protein [Aridibaculum aurantiacum]
MKAFKDLSTASKLEIIDEARSVLNGSYRTSSELEELYKLLAKMDQFAYATEVLLAKMRQDECEGRGKSAGELAKEYEVLAKFIYKDHALPSHFKFERAVRELKVHNSLSTTHSCETLGLAGAIYKRKWQFDHQFKNLILSRYYYQRGFASWKQCLKQAENEKEKDKDDKGYTAINYAYINELMAVDKLEEHGRITGITNSIYTLFDTADDTRMFILKEFIKDPFDAEPQLLHHDVDHWVLATLAEAYFGLRLYNQAIIFIKEYVQLQGTLPWQTRSFQQQLFSLAYLQMYQKDYAEQYGAMDAKDAAKLKGVAASVHPAKINECLAMLDRSSHTATAANVEVKKDGKFGLALSGGGFRASLFHIGVLASLAEKDELRHIEVISCVSGGSIIGAYYYLKLKMLLETKGDDEIVRNDYIRLVQDIEKDFLEGVQKNLRMHLFSDLLSNFRMFKKSYSRTHRLGELYEEHLFSRIFKDLDAYNAMNGTDYKIIPDANEGKFYMHDLLIRPKGAPENFTPITDNWKRKNRVPQLVLNATSVNTGHNWQFTASWMGEPPNYIQVDVDAKPRLRRMYYKEAPKAYQNFRLGYAVGASSCVPVMFHPMPLPDLYEGVDLELIDGGLHDNQGIATLIEQECTNMFISDASGQLPTNKTATGDGPGIFMRSDNILQERLRELQFLDIKQRNETSQISKLYKVHLKSNLQERPVNWKYCNDPARTLMEEYYRNNNACTVFGIDRKAQKLLSEIRTDLDSFNDVEAYALMYNGYVQSNYELNKQKQNVYLPNENLWRFAAIKPYVTNPALFPEVEKTLSIGKKQFLKVYAASKVLKYAVLALAVLLVAGAAWFIYLSWDAKYQYNFTMKAVAISVGVFILAFLSRWVAAVVNWKGTIKEYAALLALTIVGWLAFNAYLRFFNGRYNNSGKLPGNSDSQEDKGSEAKITATPGDTPSNDMGTITVFENTDATIRLN